MCASRQCNRLAANKHSSTEPDVTAVRVISIKLPTAVETTGIGRSAWRSDFGLRFLAAMVILGRVRLPCSLTRSLPSRVVPDHERTIAGGLDETLKRHSQSDITKRGWFTEKVGAVGSALCGVTHADVLLISEVREPNVRFSNRPFGVKRFQTIHHCSVDVARGLVLLFGIGTRALPSWDSRTRRNNLLGGLAGSRTAGPSGHANSPHPSSREGHLPPLGGARVFSYRV